MMTTREIAATIVSRIADDLMQRRWFFYAWSSVDNKAKILEHWTSIAENATASAGRIVDVVFDGPPGPEAGRFVEVETTDGKGIAVGEWRDRGDGMWALRLVLAGCCERDHDGDFRCDRHTPARQSYVASHRREADAKRAVETALSIGQAAMVFTDVTVDHAALDAIPPTHMSAPTPAFDLNRGVEQFQDELKRHREGKNIDPRSQHIDGPPPAIPTRDRLERVMERGRELFVAESLRHPRGEIHPDLAMGANFRALAQALLEEILGRVP